MPGRKEAEAVDQTQKASTKKRSSIKKTVEPTQAPPQVETVGVPVEMLSQLMAQIQTLTQEVGQLKAQVTEPQRTSGLGPVTQFEIDYAQAHPDLMPDDFFAEELDEPIKVIQEVDSEDFERQNPGLLAQIDQFNSQSKDPGSQTVRDANFVTQDEIDQAEANPDFIPDDFFAEELDQEIPVPDEFDSAEFESSNPGFLAEIESYNVREGLEVREALSLGELTQREIDEAQSNVEEMPAEFFGAEELDENIVNMEPLNESEFETNHPGLLAEIENFNAEVEPEAVTPEESSALLAGFDSVMAEAETEQSLVTHQGSESHDSSLSGAEIVSEKSSSESDTIEISADEIAALFAQSNVVSSPTPSEPKASGDISQDEIAALFAQNNIESSQQVAESVEGGELSADEIAALFAQNSNEVSEPISESDTNVDLSADEIAAMFSQAIPEPEQVLSDEDIAAAVESAAPSTSSFGGFDYSDDDLDGLTEEDLVALVRQNIDSQADELDLQSESDAVSATDGDSDSSEVMSAAEIAALLATPDEDDDSIPAESSAMSDEELRALLSEVEHSPEESVPNADDLNFDSPTPRMETPSNAQEKSEPVALRITHGGEQPELGAIKAVPAHLAVRAMALPIRFESGKLVCKVAEPIDQKAIDRLSKATGFGVVMQTAPIDEIITGIRVAYAEVQDTHARFAVMAGAQKRPTLVEKFAEIWKKPA